MRACRRSCHAGATTFFAPECVLFVRCADAHRRSPVDFLNVQGLSLTTLPASAVGGSGRDTALLEVPCKQSLVVRLDDTTSCDVLSASAPVVRVRAGDGADRVLAVGLDTVVRGQAGPDRLIGGAGRDRADGGKGRRDCCSAEVTRRCERP